MVVGHILRKRRQSGIFFGRSRKEGQVLIRLSPLLRPTAVICMLPQDVHAVMLFIHISLVDTHLHPLRHDAADFHCYLGNRIFGDSKVSASPPFARIRGSKFPKRNFFLKWNSWKTSASLLLRKQELLKYKFSFSYCVVYRSTFIYAFI